mmetsp:Transcript_18112/g.54524  ORF Transcript_18112/g.54524 Transcript_18112/m.54524 type:complete len:195 (-) Transcript_18112:2458-3042(-)
MQTLDERLDARMQHLRTKFDGSDDVREAQQLLAHHDELQNMSAADEDRIHTIIQDMQRVVEQAQAAATPPDPAVHATSVQQLQTECRESSVRVTSLENEARDLEDQREELRQRRAETEERSASSARDMRATDPRLRTTLSLYAHISRIIWSDQKPNVIAGKVSDPEQQDVRSFNLDTSTLSHFDAVNRVWDVIA